MIEHMFSASAERAVIGCALGSPKIIEWLGVGPEHFAVPKHRAVWLALEGIVGDAYADLVNLEDNMRRSGTLEAIGGLIGLVEIEHAGALIDNVENYAEILEELRITREVAEVASRVTGWLEAGIEGGALLDTLLGELAHVGNRRASGARTIRQVVGDEISAIEAHLAKIKAGTATHAGVPTGIEKLDTLTGGIPVGPPTIIAARPGVGKSSLALNIALSAWRSGYGVHMLTCEDSVSTLAQRVLAHSSRIAVSRIRARDLGETGDLVRLARTANDIAHRDGPGLLLMAAHGKSVRWLTRQVLTNKRDNATRLVIVDYIGRMPSPEPRLKKREAIEANVDALVALGGEHDLAVIIVAQLNRDIERRGDGALPVLSDLAESGSLEQAGKLILMLSRHGDDLDILVRKNHQGETGVVGCTFDRAHCRIEG